MVKLHSQDMVGLGQTKSAVNRVPVSSDRAQNLRREKQSQKLSISFNSYASIVLEKVYEPLDFLFEFLYKLVVHA